MAMSDNSRKNLDYRNQLMLYTPGYWFMYPRELHFLLKPDEALVLATLIDTATKLFTRYPKSRETGWFYYTIESMEWDTGLDDQRQDRILRTLIQKDYIEKDRRGQPAKRYFWINIEKINTEVMELRAKREALNDLRIAKMVEKYEEQIIEEHHELQRFHDS